LEVLRPPCKEIRVKEPRHEFQHIQCICIGGGLQICISLDNATRYLVDANQPLPIGVLLEVKVIARTNQTLSAIKMAVVLTVLTSAPPAGGSVTFRPPYAGTTNRPLYTISDLQTNLLPAYLRSGLTNYPSLATTASNFSRGLILDFHS